MNWWQGVVVGAVQGFTEFLPVSSSGHLVVVEALVGLRAPGVTVEVLLHVATLLAVLIVYWRRIVQLLRGTIARDGGSWRYLGLLVLATVPAAATGALFHEFFERTFHSLPVVGVDFLITGAILWSTRRPMRRAALPEPTVTGALGIGLAQALAILPGVSRSGSTVSAGIWAGVDPVRAAEFSFLMSIPAIAGAAALELPVLAGGGAEAVGRGALAASFVAAMVSGIVAIRILVALLSRRAFHRFAPYCWAIGTGTIAWRLFAG